MELNRLRMVMVIVSGIIYGLILVSVPFRVKYVMKRSGKLIVSTAKKNIMFQIVSVILSGALLGILFFRELGFFSDLIICLVAILGSAMGSEDGALSGKNGLYENGLIGNGHFLPLSEIVALPALSYSKEEQEALNQNVMMVTTESKGTVNYLFDSAEEKKLVENELLKLNPALKP